MQEGTTEIIKLRCISICSGETNTYFKRTEDLFHAVHTLPLNIFSLAASLDNGETKPQILQWFTKHLL